jgi:two-component system, cell cycle sensor histidine kinase and response regulator CckA
MALLYDPNRRARIRITVSKVFRSLQERPLARVVGLYLLVGGLWILLTDRALGMLTSDPARLLQLQTAKGWIFVLASGLLIYLLVRSSMKRLRETEELVGQVAEHTSASIWSYTADNREALYLSPSSETLWGRSLAEMYRDPLFFQEHIHPEDRDDTLATLRRLSGKMAVEYRIIRGDGEVRWLRSLSSPIRDEAGRHERTVGITEDVTDEKRAEARLRESQERFRQLADYIPQVFWMSSLDKNQMIYVSPAYEDIWGRSREAILDQADDWLDGVHPEDRDAVRAALPRQVEGTYDEEYRIVRPDGEVRWVRDRAFVVRNDQGEPYRLAGIAEDTTERKRREENLLLLEAALEQAGEGVIITDVTGVIQYVNPAFEAVTGYSQNEALGQTPRILNSGKQNAAYYRHMWARLRRGEPWRGRIVNRRRDGELYTQETVITPVRSGGGDITHMVAVFGDVSERIRLEEQFRQAQKMEAIGRLAGGIAHDFNNVLTVIDGHAQFALEDLTGHHPLRTDLEEIVAAADRATRLTRQLLTFSRQQVHDPVVLELGHVIGRAERMLGRLIGEDVELEVSVDPELGRVLADPTQIEQVLTNLVINASDAMPGGGKLRVDASNVELDQDFTHRFAYPVHPGRYVRLAITDTGSGMDPDTLAHIFEPFFSTKDRDKGTGLGLATVYGIVKQSGGYIWVYSEPDEGTSFKIYLPRTDRTPAPPPGEPATGVGTYTGSETVLVAEDQDGVRSLIRRGLERAGYRVREADSGIEALRIFEQDPDAIDLLITDVVMPAMGGRELCDRVHAIRPELRVLFMSGYAENEIARRGALNPDMHFLEKPFEHTALQRKVREVLDAPASAR